MPILGKIVVISILTLLIMPSFSFAQMNPTVQQLQNTIAPDNPFYFFKTFVEDVRLAFARTPETQATLQSEFAAEREKEITILQIHNRPDLIPSVADRLNKHIMVLQNLQLTLPVQAQLGIGNAISNSQRVLHQLPPELTTTTTHPPITMPYQKILQRGK